MGLYIWFYLTCESCVRVVCGVDKTTHLTPPCLTHNPHSLLRLQCPQKKKKKFPQPRISDVWLPQPLPCPHIGLLILN